jgi:xylan 1,4-beta-xylosidase
VDVEYNVALFYLMFWPDLLGQLLRQWRGLAQPHAASGGAVLHHDLGRGVDVAGQASYHDVPIEGNADYLLLLQAFVHVTGDLAPARELVELVEQLAAYLLWTDRDASGFPTEGTANTIDDGGPAIQFARKQTYLAVKRLAGLQAAADLLARIGRPDAAERIERLVDADTRKVEDAAWLGDHYAVCMDRSATGLVDAGTGAPLTMDDLPGWDAYSIYTANALLLPAMTSQPLMLDRQRLATDIYNAMRETTSAYGCGHTSVEPEDVWISQNVWRDLMAMYMGLDWPTLLTQRYWDLQVMSNTHQQSLGYIDTYIHNQLCFYPRGVASLGYLSAQPRLVVDRLAPGGARVSVDPPRDYPQRWPLFPLADWKAGKIPVCVVDDRGEVHIEGETDPVIVAGKAASGVIG